MRSPCIYLCPTQAKPVTVDANRGMMPHASAQRNNENLVGVIQSLLAMNLKQTEIIQVSGVVCGRAG